MFINNVNDNFNLITHMKVFFLEKRVILNQYLGDRHYLRFVFNKNNVRFDNLGQ